MPASVYIETSVISYYTARSSRDLVAAARQTITQEWWEESRNRFELYVSTVVIAEAKTGDPEAAQKRMLAIADLPVLDVNAAAEDLARQLVDQKLIPATSAEDALHIALATINGMDFLLTWNFRHINNAEMKARIIAAIEALGYECPILCSPEELGGTEP